MDALTKDVRKNVLGALMYAYDIAQCGDDETDMTEYSDTCKRALENRGMRISRSKIQSIDFKFGQDNGKWREPVNILGDELHRGDVRHGNINYTQSESSKEELEEIMWCCETRGCQ